MDYIVIRVYEHYEVYDNSGRFLFSADNPSEIKAELALLSA